jgi:hypothetical protein
MSPEEPRFDVFLSHNGQDKPVVRELKRMLVGEGLTCWLDVDELVPGENWIPGLEAGIRASVSVAVCFGPAGIGPWEDEEMQAALVRAVREKRRVIPVLLPGAPFEPDMPMFLANRTWVDLRAGFTEEGLERLIWGITSRKPPLKPKPVAPPPELDIARVAKFVPPILFGRFGELAELDAALADPETRVYSLIAFGGVGKTSLAASWLARVAADGWRGLARAFAWSFYSQGTKDDGAASSDAFFGAAFEFFGETDPKLAQLSPWDKGARLARRVAEKPTLLVLDGLEPLQHPPGPLDGRLKDQAIEALLITLAQPSRSAGLCLVTSREPVTELAGLPGTAQRNLEFLSDEAGAALLHSLGVNRAGASTIRPDDAELKAASRALHGHALSLRLLGLYLKGAHGGDARKRDTVDLSRADAAYKTNPKDRDRPYGHAFKVMAAYEKWLAEGGVDGERQLAVLRLLGLFDRPADPPCLAVLRDAPPIPGLTEPLAGLDEADWNLAVSALETAGLVQRTPWEPRPVAGYDEATARQRMEHFARLETFPLGEPTVFPARHSPLTTRHSLDAHPLLRGYFARRLREMHPDAWREGHRRLYAQLTASVPYWPEGEAGLQPLYQAVAHGCRAGLYEEARAEVYRDRIGRRGEFYSTNKLGLFGADLGAVAGFFESLWTRPRPELAEAWRAWLLNEAAVSLRALGRLAEALEPMRAGMEMLVEKDWKNAAVTAGNLSELELTLGRVAAAVADAGRAVDYADRSGDWAQRMTKRTTLADARHQAGDAAGALALFGEAEALQVERQPDYPLLYSLPGFRYCDALLAEAERAAWRVFLPSPPGRGVGGEGIRASSGMETAGACPHPGPLPEGEGAECLAACRAVAERGQKMFEWRTPGDSLLGIALDHLTLARAALYAALLDLSGQPADWAAARVHADAAVDGLRASGNQDELPRGLLTRAWLRAIEARPSPLAPLPEGGGLDAARADLAEAERLATRGDMRLHLADVYLYRARLFRDRQALAEARRLIEACGYGRRLGELADAEAAARGW